MLMVYYFIKKFWRREFHKNVDFFLFAYMLKIIFIFNLKLQRYDQALCEKKSFFSPLSNNLIVLNKSYEFGYTYANGAHLPLS